MFSQVVNASLLIRLPERNISPALEVDLHLYRNRFSPPNPTGWAWSEEMRVWIPEQFTYYSAAIVASPYPHPSPPEHTEDIDIPYPYEVEVSRRAWWRRRRPEPKQKPKIELHLFDCAANGATFANYHLDSIAVAQQKEESRRANQCFLMD